MTSHPRLTVYQFFAIWLIVISVVTQTAAEWERISPIYLLACGVLIVLLAFYDDGRYLHRLNTSKKEVRTLEVCIVTFVTLFPVSIFIVNGWDGEIPFGGDQLSHLSQAYRVGLYWISPIGISITDQTFTPSDLILLYSENPLSLLFVRGFLFSSAILIGLFSYLRWRNGRLLIGFAVIFLLCWGIVDESRIFRWPTLSYVLAMPFTGLAIIGEWENKLNGLRLSGFVAPLFWLLVLRPRLVGEYPRIEILPVVGLIFWQGHTIRLVGSAYPEPWAWILLLTAVEVVLKQKHKGQVKALLLVSAAAMIKEPAIVVLPFVWLAGISRKRQFIFGDILLGVAAAVPFVMYFLVRMDLGLQIDGTISGQGRRYWNPTVDFSSIYNLGIRYWREMTSNYQVLGVTLFALPLVSAIITLIGRPAIRWSFGWIIVAVLSLFLFFLVDYGTTPNMRMVLWGSIMLISSMLVIKGRGNIHWPTRKTALLMTIGIFVLLIQSRLLWLHKEAVFEANSAANFFISRGEPIYVPIKELLEDVEEAGREISYPIRANYSDPFVHGSRYSNTSTMVEFVGNGDLWCECTEQNPTIMNMFIFPANNRIALRNIKSNEINQRRSRLWVTQLEKSRHCFKQMVKTCDWALKKEKDDIPIGYIGSIGE